MWQTCQCFQEISQQASIITTTALPWPFWRFFLPAHEPFPIFCRTPWTGGQPTTKPVHTQDSTLMKDADIHILVSSEIQIHDPRIWIAKTHATGHMTTMTVVSTFITCQMSVTLLLIQMCEVLNCVMSNSENTKSVLTPIIYGFCRMLNSFNDEEISVTR
jgi:hypothetical protein